MSGIKKQNMQIYEKKEKIYLDCTLFTRKLALFKK